jgi:hypothetical protein
MREGEVVRNKANPEVLARIVKVRDARIVSEIIESGIAGYIGTRLSDDKDEFAQHWELAQ